MNIDVDQPRRRKLNNKSIKMNVDIYTLMNARDTSKTMKIGVFDTGEVTCNCMDYKFRCNKNNVLCKHCCYILLIGLKIPQANIEGRFVTNTVYQEKKHILTDKFNKKDEEPEKQPTEQTELIDDDCQICLMELDSKEDLHVCWCCKKRFHKGCIQVWVDKSAYGNCPNCRSEIILENKTDSSDTLDISEKIKKLKKVIDK